MRTIPRVENLSDLCENELALLGIDFNKPVRVYWNLHKKVFSIMQGGKVLCHTESVHLHTVQYVVNEGGRIRVLREGKKYVHAFVVGYIDADYWVNRSDAQHGPHLRVTYNPYVGPTFFRSIDNETRRSSSLVHCQTIGLEYKFSTRPCILEIER